jgi:tetratricopeptide (TPR) repeat protein
LVVALIASPLSAQDHAERGRQLYADERYAEAAQAFAQAYQQTGNPKYVYNQAQAERQAGDCRAAISSYREFLDHEPSDDQREKTENNIEVCEHELESQPAPIIRELPPSEPPTVEPPPPSPVPPISERDTSAGAADERRAAPWWGVGLGLGLVASGVAVAGAGAGVFGWAVLVVSDASDPDAQLGRSYQDQRDQLDRAQTARTAGAVVLGAGGLLMVGAIIRFAVAADDDSSAMAPAVFRF